MRTSHLVPQARVVEAVDGIVNDTLLPVDEAEKLYDKIKEVNKEVSITYIPMHTTKANQ